MNKPFSQACENNKLAILNGLKEFFSDTTDVLEVGSGTGQHSAIRDFAAICQLAEQAGLTFVEDVQMPANNQLLLFKRQ